MHLLVLGAFRLTMFSLPTKTEDGLNAPSGAWCFPTVQVLMRHRSVATSLNAPSGAWCFPTKRISYRRSLRRSCLNAPSGAWCFPTALAAIVRRRSRAVSQCTFWCLVLSDTITATHPSIATEVSMHLLVLGAFRLTFDGARMGYYPFRVSMHLLVLGAFRPVSAFTRR